MDEGPRRLEPVAARADLREAAADRQSQIAARGDTTDEGGRRRAEAGPEPERVGLGKDALPLNCGGDRPLDPLRQGDQVEAGTGGAQPEIDERPLAVSQQVEGPLQRRRLGFHVCRRLGRPLQLRLVPEDVVVDRDLHEDRASGRRARDPAGAAHGRVDLRPLLGPQLRLRHRGDHRTLVDVVQLVGHAAVAADPARQHQHRDPVQVGLGDAGERVREPSPGHQVGAAQRLRRAGDGVGHEGSALLVGDQDGANACGAVESVVQLDVVGARDAKGEGDMLVLERANHDLTARQLAHRGCLTLSGPELTQPPGGYPPPPGRPGP